ncbi:MoaD/ThiS family protein [Natrinema caseinilyticum]|uniref:MoaD/ThiS family protein n=1 Tax=Natrinema caseinilyticum TaxID=2961570 RepID=UPI0030F412AD
MQLECLFFGPFRDDIGRKTVYHETDAETVGELLIELETAFPELEGRLLGDDGSGLAGETVVTKDKKHVTHLDGLDTSIAADDVIRLVPSVYGG